MPIYNPPPTAVPTAHHTTHEVGGADLIANNAWTNQQNTFTVDQKISGNLALGDAALGTTNVARTDLANTFASGQFFSGSNPNVTWRDTSQAADLKIFDIVNTSQTFVIRTVNDAFNAELVRVLTLTRGGDAQVSRDLYEKGRTTPMGHWVAVPYSAGNFTAGGGGTWTVDAGDQIYYGYSVVGKTMWVQFQIAFTTTTGVVTSLRIATPSGFTLAGLNVPQTIYTNAGNAVGISGGWGTAIVKGDSAAYFSLGLDINTTVQWPVMTNSLYVYGSATFPLA